MAQQWEIESPTGRCAVNGRVLAEGEEFHAVLFEDGESFRRVDYSVDAWTGPPEGAFCHFRSRVPVKEAKRRLLVNDELLVGFFQRLAGETEPIRVQFRFVLALILMRKRVLRYETSSLEAGSEIWDMRLTRDQTRHRVVNPNLTDDQVEAVSRELSAVLHDDMGQWADQTDAGDADSAEPAASSQGES